MVDSSTRRVPLKKMAASGAEQVGIVTILAAADRGERTIGDVCRGHGVSEATFYNWRKRFRGMGVEGVREYRELKQENARTTASRIRSSFFESFGVGVSSKKTEPSQHRPEYLPSGLRRCDQLSYRHDLGDDALLITRSTLTPKSSLR